VCGKIKVSISRPFFVIFPVLSYISHYQQTLEIDMSRSYKKTPIVGTTTAETEKSAKRIWHKQLRHETKQLIKSSHNDPELLEDVTFPDEKEVSSVWVMPKDGKKYIGQWLRNNMNFFRKMMGK